MWADLWDAIEALAPGIREAVMATFRDMRSVVDIRRLELAWMNGTPEAVASLLLGTQGSTVWDGLLRAITGAIEEAASDTVAIHIKGHGDILRVVTRLGEDPRVIHAVSGTSIREIDSATRKAIVQYVQDSLRAGTNPTQGITQLVGRVNAQGVREGGLLGLTDSQMTSVQNYRRMLEGGPKVSVYAEALQRDLRDGRFDPTIRRAMESGFKLTPAQVDQMVGRYEARYLAYRAQTIGITEAGQAQAAGQKAAWDTSLARGIITTDELEKRWVTAGDDRVRPYHAEMNNVIVPYRNNFMVKVGGKKTFRVVPVWGPPHDPRCRCVCSIRPRLDA